MLHGAQPTKPGEVEWDIAGDCMRPFCVFRHEIAHDMWRQLRQSVRARRVTKRVVDKLRAQGLDVDLSHVRTKTTSKSSTAYKVTIWVRCRSCERCLRATANAWMGRAINETQQSVRTWFCTLTLRPQMQDHYRNIARVRAAKRGIDFDALDDNERFSLHCTAIYQEVKRYIKRIRKNTNAGLRLLAIFERHDGEKDVVSSGANRGQPHLHLLVHQLTSAAIKYEDLDTWPLGFIKANLVRNREAGPIYVCKYITKSAGARVRASTDYGALRQSLGHRTALETYPDAAPSYDGQAQSVFSTGV